MLRNPDKDVKCGVSECGKFFHLSCILKHKYSKVSLKINIFIAGKLRKKLSMKNLQKHGPVRFTSAIVAKN